MKNAPTTGQKFYVLVRRSDDPEVDAEDAAQNPLEIKEAIFMGYEHAKTAEVFSPNVIEGKALTGYAFDVGQLWTQGLYSSITLEQVSDHVFPRTRKGYERASAVVEKEAKWGRKLASVASKGGKILLEFVKRSDVDDQDLETLAILTGGDPRMVARAEGRKRKTAALFSGRVSRKEAA